jgi:hypothetical protein
MKLTNEELLKLEGGIKYSILAIVGTIGVFIAGVIDGILRPLKCN